MRVMARARRIVARRPWIQWVVVAALALAVAASVTDAMTAVDAERAAWGRSATVWVATADAQAGGPIHATPRAIPRAVRPPGAVGEPVDGATARQAIGRGEIVTRLDVVSDDRGLAPTGWLVAPLRESLPSGAGVGERVHVVSDGLVLAADAIVIDRIDDVTLVAVPPDVAPLVAASESAVIALLRRP